LARSHLRGIGAGRARTASTDRSPTASDAAARESAKIALQKYRAAFDLMRKASNSCSGWTDDDSPVKTKPTAFTSGGGNKENDM
jgi:hypothetical protein